MISDEMLTKAVFEVDAAILDMLPATDECNHIFSLSFQNKINKLIKKAKHFVAYKVLKRVACVFLAVVMSGCLFIAFNANARAAIVDWVSERFNEFYHYFFIGDDSNSEPSNTSALDETEGTELSNSHKAYCLGWLPEGYVVLDSFEDGFGETFIYANDVGQMFQFGYVYGSESYPMFTGVGEYEQKYINEGTLQAELLLALSSEDSSVITWTGENGNVRFTISGFINEADLIKMAKYATVQENN